MAKTKVITRRGGTPQKMAKYIETNPLLITGYQVIILNLGTNWLSGKEEWGLYLKLINSVITKETYETQLSRLNPPPALGNALDFKNSFQELVDLIKSINKEAVILVSSIIPRQWDHNRRHLVRISYNQILRRFNDQPNVFFIPSYKPFFDENKNLKSELFDRDGLHLSDKGAVVLMTFFCEKIDKCLKGVLK